jgi:hypothetical protein
MPEDVFTATTHARICQVQVPILSLQQFTYPLLHPHHVGVPYQCTPEAGFPSSPASQAMFVELMVRTQHIHRYRPINCLSTINQFYER